MNTSTGNKIILGLIFGCAALWTSVLVAQQPPSDGPRYANATSLVRPADYREWPFLGSSLGLAYGDRSEAAATLQSMRAAVERAKLDLGFTQVLAPVSGRTSRALLTLGNLVNADSTVLTPWFPSIRSTLTSTSMKAPRSTTRG